MVNNTNNKSTNEYLDPILNNEHIAARKVNAAQRLTKHTHLSYEEAHSKVEAVFNKKMKKNSKYLEKLFTKENHKATANYNQQLESLANLVSLEVLSAAKFMEINPNKSWKQAVKETTLYNPTSWFSKTGFTLRENSYSWEYSGILAFALLANITVKQAAETLGTRPADGFKGWYCVKALTGINVAEDLTMDVKILSNKKPVLVREKEEEVLNIDFKNKVNSVAFKKNLYESFFYDLSDQYPKKGKNFIESLNNLTKVIDGFIDNKLCLPSHVLNRVLLEFDEILFYPEYKNFFTSKNLENFTNLFKKTVLSSSEKYYTYNDITYGYSLMYDINAGDGSARKFYLANDDFAVRSIIVPTVSKNGVDDYKTSKESLLNYYGVSASEDMSIQLKAVAAARNIKPAIYAVCEKKSTEFIEVTIDAQAILNILLDSKLMFIRQEKINYMITDLFSKNADKLALKNPSIGEIKVWNNTPPGKVFNAHHVQGQNRFVFENVNENFTKMLESLVPTQIEELLQSYYDRKAQTARQLLKSGFEGRAAALHALVEHLFPADASDMPLQENENFESIINKFTAKLRTERRRTTNKNRLSRI